MTFPGPSALAPRCTRLVPPSAARGGAIDPEQRTGPREQARALVRAVLRAVPPPRPWSMNAWVDGLEAWRGREIDLVPVHFTPGQPSGAWQARPGYDLVAYVEHTSTLHQDHIIAHELGHLLAAHEGTCVLAEADAAELAPDLGPSAFSHLLTRVTTDADEYAAELFAVLVMSEATAAPPSVRPEASGPAADRARRLASLLG